MNEETFKAWKYFSNKLILPGVGMSLWTYMISTNVLVTLEERLYVGAGLLMFSGVFSAQSAWDTYWENKNGNKEK